MIPRSTLLALLAFGAIGVAFSGNCNAQAASPTPVVNDFETVKEYLLDSAAADFFEHQPPFPTKFRKVRLGHVDKDKKDAMYRLCGEFLAADENGKARWTRFATIKTSGYEQYLGSSTTYCTDPKIIWAKTGDLSTTLKNRLDAIKNKKQQ